jgi:hypothetical protein
LVVLQALKQSVPGAAWMRPVRELALLSLPYRYFRPDSASEWSVQSSADACIAAHRQTSGATYDKVGQH